MTTITPYTGSLSLTGNISSIEIPWLEPVTISDVEGQIRATLDDENAVVEIFIEAIRERAEAITRRALIVKNEVLTLDAFPVDKIELPNPPLRSVISIVYKDSNGDETTLSTSEYRVVFNSDNPAQPSYIIPIYGGVWPITLNDRASVKVNYICGYGSFFNSQTDLYEILPVPKSIKQWILLNVANLYEHRETLQVANGRNSLIDLSTLADSLLNNFRITKF